jgi:hypothetical protein
MRFPSKRSRFQDICYRRDHLDADPVGGSSATSPKTVSTAPSFCTTRRHVCGDRSGTFAFHTKFPRNNSDFSPQSSMIAEEFFFSLILFRFHPPSCGILSSFLSVVKARWTMTSTHTPLPSIASRNRPAVRPAVGRHRGRPSGACSAAAAPLWDPRPTPVGPVTNSG